MNEHIRKLESSILELGSEIYLLRSQMLKTREMNDRLVKMFQSLRNVLDEKSVISQEEFDLSIIVDELPDQESRPLWSEAGGEPKKFSH